MLKHQNITVNIFLKKSSIGFGVVHILNYKLEQLGKCNLTFSLSNIYSAYSWPWLGVNNKLALDFPFKIFCSMQITPQQTECSLINLSVLYEGLSDTFLKTNTCGEKTSTGEILFKEYI